MQTPNKRCRFPGDILQSYTPLTPSPHHASPCSLSPLPKLYNIKVSPFLRLLCFLQHHGDEYQTLDPLKPNFKTFTHYKPYKIYKKPMFEFKVIPHSSLLPQICKLLAWRTTSNLEIPTHACMTASGPWSVREVMNQNMHKQTDQNQNTSAYMITPDSNKLLWLHEKERGWWHANNK